MPAFIALALYALLPIVRNTHTALTQISRGMKDAARSLGLEERTILARIELPLAADTIMAGIKTSAVINVGTATIAAFIGAGGYGERIVTGLALNDHAMLLAGAIPAAVLALAIEGGFRVASAGLCRKACCYTRADAAATVTATPRSGCGSVEPPPSAFIRSTDDDSSDCRLRISASCATFSVRCASRMSRYGA